MSEIPKPTSSIPLGPLSDPNLDMAKEISVLHQEQVRSFQEVTWTEEHFVQAVAWDVGAIEKFLQIRCLGSDRAESIIFRGEVGERGGDGSSRGGEGGGDKSGITDGVVLIVDKNNELSRIHEFGLVEQQPSIPSTTANGEVLCGDKIFNDGTVYEIGQTLESSYCVVEKRRSNSPLYHDDRRDLKRLWDNAIGPYFGSWNPSDKGRVLVKSEFEVKIHGKDITIFTIFCALAAVLNIAPLSRHPTSPNGLTDIEHQWCLLVLLGKWIRIISSPMKIPYVICVMSRVVGNETKYICGTTKPKITGRDCKPPQDKKESMRKSRHKLVDDAIGMHPLALELESIVSSAEEVVNTEATDVSTDHGQTGEVTIVAEAVTREALWGKILGFSIGYKARVAGKRSGATPKSGGDQSMQEIGDCAEVWGLATLVRQELGENKILSVSMNQKTIKVIEINQCTNNGPPPPGSLKRACDNCVYLFDVARYNTNINTVDTMYPDGLPHDIGVSGRCEFTCKACEQAKIQYQPVRFIYSWWRTRYLGYHEFPH